MFKFKQKQSKSERRPTNSGVPNRVYSYYNLTKKRSTKFEENRKYTKKNREKKFQKILILRWLVVAGMMAIFGSIIYASNTPIMRIDSSEVMIEDRQVYVDSAKKLIESNIFSKTKITFDYLDFEKKMKDKHPEIDSVSTSYALIGSRPVIRLTFHKPSLLVTSLGRTWIADDRGVAIAKYKESLSKLPKLIDEIGVAIEEGDALVSSSDVDFINKLQTVAAEKGIIIDKFTTPIIPKQLDVRVVGENYYTKFNLNEEPAGQIGTWLVARDNLKAIGQTPNEYLDIRAAEKVYWK